MTYDPVQVEQALLVWLKRRGREANIRASYAEKVLPLSLEIVKENAAFVQPLRSFEPEAQTFFRQQFPEHVAEAYKTKYECSHLGWPTWAVERRRVLHLARKLADLYVQHPVLLPD